MPNPMSTKEVEVMFNVDISDVLLSAMKRKNLSSAAHIITTERTKLFISLFN